MHILWEAIIGLIVGAVAKFLMPGKDPGVIFIKMAMVIAVSIVENFFGQTIGLYKAGESAGFLMSIAGAVLLLFIYRLIRGKMAKP